MFWKSLVRLLCIEKCLKFETPYRCFHKIDNNVINDLVPGISISQIKQILRQVQISNIEGHACVIIDCSLCDTAKSKKGKIYINKTTGNFLYVHIYIYNLNLYVYNI